MHSQLDHGRIRGDTRVDSPSISVVIRTTMRAASTARRWCHLFARTIGQTPFHPRKTFRAWLDFYQTDGVLSVNASRGVNATRKRGENEVNIGTKRYSAAAVLSAALLAAGVGVPIATATNAAASTANTACHAAPSASVGIVDQLASAPIDLLTDQAVEQAATKLGWSYHFVDSNYNVTTALQAINSYISDKVKLIVVTSWGQDQIRAGIVAAKKAGIPVVEVGAGGGNTNLYTAAYNENETQIASVLARYMVTHIKSAHIALLGTNAIVAGTLRDNALKAAVAGTHGKATIDYSVNANLTDPGPEVQAALAAHPDINTFFLVFDDMVVPAAAELRTLHSNAKIYSFYTEATNLQLLKSGQIAALGTANLPLGGVVAVDQELNHLAKGTAFNPNAEALAGGLKYQVVTKPVAPFSLAHTIAPFASKWKSEGYCVK